MTEKQQFIDRFTRQDELLAQMIPILQDIRDRDSGGGQDVFTLSYPYDATYLTIAAGATVYDFEHGTVSAPGAAVVPMSASLAAQRKDFMRSLVVDSNKNTILQLDGQDKMIVHAGRWLFPHKQFRKVRITATESTDLFVVAGTHPDIVDVAGELVVRGDDSGTLRTVAVDGSGNMVAVMKGDYGGVLDTIAVDDHGRMLSIITDPEDVWGESHGIGMGEAVARLGSNMRFERRGDVLFVDDFESSTLKYNEFSPGSPNTIARCIDTALSGDFSVKCVTAANIAHYAGISYTINNYHVSKVGAEISFATPDAKVDTILSMVYNTDNKYYKASLKFDNNTNRLYYLDDANAWQNALPSSLWYERGIRSWATMKLVIDLSTKKYVRGFVTRDESDLSTYDIFNAISASDFLTINAYIRPSENVAKTAYLDNFVLTENEPA